MFFIDPDNNKTVFFLFSFFFLNKILFRLCVSASAYVGVTNRENIWRI